MKRIAAGGGRKSEPLEAKSGSGCSLLTSSPSPPNRRASLCNSLEPHKDRFAILVLLGGSGAIMRQSPRELLRDLDLGIRMVTSSDGLNTGAEAG